MNTLSKKKFKEILNRKGIAYSEKDGLIVISENNGSVYLESLTTLPEGIKFENHGYVYLESLTTLPEGIKFENHGYVDLRSLTTLPEGIKFENHGYVYLESLSGKTFKYLGSDVSFLEVDTSTMIILSVKEKDGIKIYESKYFGGGKIDDLKSCYIAEKGEYTAHGKTEIEAIEDLDFKIKSVNFDKKEHAKTIIERGTVTGTDYRLLTGSCRLGVKEFKDRNNITENELPLEKVLEIIKGEYGSNEFKSFF